MKPVILVGSSIFILIVLIAAVPFINQKSKTSEKHIEVALREVGHQLLLSAKDSSSRVLPVNKLNDHTYQISFQNEFGFISDTLINLIQRTFQKAGLADDYIVNLRTCGQNENVFAFEINNRTGDLTPCRGRKLDVGCYVVEIDFLKTAGFSPFWLALLIIPLGVVGYSIRKKIPKKEEAVPVVDTTDYIQLGSFRFDVANNVLKTENSHIALSEKETKALQLFSENMAQTVEREHLMKELWEDEGVVVISRNVDVLVSKLRKKLSEDSSIKILTVPGRGYKFVIE